MRHFATLLVIFIQTISTTKCTPNADRNHNLELTVVKESMDSLFSNNDNQKCEKALDSLTNEYLVFNPEYPAENSGGSAKLMRAFETKLIADSTVDIYKNPVRIAFVIDTSGSISAMRILPHSDSTIANQMITIVKSFKWIPASCSNKKVVSLRTLSMTLEYQ